MSSALDKLKSGIATFQRETYPQNAERYRKAASEPQRPHTLMITCADSRIDIETVTHSAPGELFIMRNVGNVVPAYGEQLGGVSAVIEYAVMHLHVSHVVICGHSDCGAMKALLAPNSLDALPTVKRWMQNSQAALSVSQSMAEHDERPSAALGRLTERNVLLQLQHLATHPSVAGAMARGELSASGWVYDLGTGHVKVSEYGDPRFHEVDAAKTSPET